ncbi:hypothetical protein [Corynebacterium matruchotii]|nr:hypothetical protein [Corynebacterium matruchotii]
MPPGVWSMFSDVDTRRTPASSNARFISTSSALLRARRSSLWLMSIPAVIAHHARRTVLRYKADHPFTSLLLTALNSFQALPAP